MKPMKVFIPVSVYVFLSYRKRERYRYAYKFYNNYTFFLQMRVLS